jgi:hypothetical protein
MPTPSTQRNTTLDAVLAAWVVSWMAIGLWVALEVRHLGDVSASVKSVGGAVVQAGDAISGLSGIPVVGDAVAKPGRPISDAGREAQATAADARGSAHRLAVLLGLSIALIPSGPLLLVRFTRLGCRCREAPAV